MKRLCWLLALMLLSVSAGCDSEPERPATKTSAIAEATATIESLGDEMFHSGYDEVVEWAPPSGCGEHPKGQGQGEFGYALLFRYEHVTGAGDESQDMVSALATRWQAQGHDVDRSGADMSPSVTAHINGIKYVLVFFPPDASLQAWIPCY